MTIAQGGQCVNVSRQKQFSNSNEQKETTHEAVQVELVQTSDLCGKLHYKEQQVTAMQHQQLAFLQERHDLCAEKQGKSKMICGNKKRMEEDEKYLYEPKLFAEGVRTKEKNTDGGFDHLLILAHSAELLLESEDNFCHYKMNDQSHEDQSYMENALDAAQENGKIVVENNASLLQGITRLTQIRRQARMKNFLVVQEIKVKKTNDSADIKGFEGTGNRERLAADQIQIAVDLQDIEALPVFEQTHYRRKKTCLDKPWNGLHQLPVEHHSEIVNEPRELVEQYAACQLNLLKADKPIDPSEKRYLNSSQGEVMHPLMNDRLGQMSMTQSHLLVQTSDMQKNHRSIVCQQRLVRTLKRKKHHCEKHCDAAQMRASGMPNTNSSTAWEQKMRRTLEQGMHHRDKHNGAPQKECKLMVKGKMNQIYGAKRQWVWHTDVKLHEASQKLQLHVSDLERSRHCLFAKEIVEQIEGQRLSQNKHPEREMHLEVNQSFQQRSVTKFCKDQWMELPLIEQVHANAQVEKTTLCPRRQIRLSQLKREARS